MLAALGKVTTREFSGSGSLPNSPPGRRWIFPSICVVRKKLVTWLPLYSPGVVRISWTSSRPAAGSRLVGRAPLLRCHHGDTAWAEATLSVGTRSASAG